VAQPPSAVIWYEKTQPRAAVLHMNFPGDFYTLNVVVLG